MTARELSSIVLCILRLRGVSHTVLCFHAVIFYMHDGALAIWEDCKIVMSWNFIANQGNSWKNQGNSWKIKENWYVVKENG